MNKEKLEILNSDSLTELYINFSQLHVTNEFLIFESRFSTFYKKPQKHINYVDDILIEALSKIKFEHLEMIKKRIIENKTLQEIANEYSVTRERVRQIEQNDVKKLNFYCKDLIIQTLADLLRYSILYVDELPIKNEDLKLLYCGLVSHAQSKS
jgi:hypothetical protein